MNAFEWLRAWLLAGVPLEVAAEVAGLPLSSARAERQRRNARQVSNTHRLRVLNGLGNADLLGCVAKGVEDFPPYPRLLDPQFAVAPVQVIAAAGKVLRLLEIWQHVVPRPAGIPELAPDVVVARLAAHIQHAVDGRRAA